MNKILFLFKTTRLVIKSENLLNDNGIENKIIPVPKKYSSNCGMAIEVSSLLKDKCEKLFNNNNISYILHNTKPEIKLTTLVKSGGCSAKLDPVKLDKLLKGITEFSSDSLLVSMDSHDDAAIVKINKETCLIQTLDFFPPVVDDPFEFGEIAAANALSDVYAMGGKPLTAMNIVLFPAEGLNLEILREIIEGGASKIKESGALLVGGHTIEDAIPKFGCSITGIVDEKEFITNEGAQEGDILVLTKFLGTGIVLAAYKVSLEGNYLYEEVTNSMKRLNREPALLMKKYEIKGGTDVTGFGLLGHAYRFASSSKVTFEIELDRLPLFTGVKSLIDKGCIPGGCIRNLEFIKENVEFKNNTNLKWVALDPQTSGGLLLAVSPEKVDDFIYELKTKGENVTIIGKVSSQKNRSIIII